jgi:chromosome transmission fidelity protein 1
MLMFLIYSGVRLAGNIIIIDEAHNLIESINDVHGAQVNLRDLRKAHSQLSQYLEKYQTRLKRCNLVNIRQILDMLQSCMQYLGGWKKPGASPAGIVPTSQNENPNTGSATASRSLNFGLPPLPESESASQNHLISAPQHDGFVSSAAVSDHFIAPVKNFKVGAPTPDSKATVPASPFVNNSSSQTSVFRSNELTFSLKMDNINLLQIVRYMDDSEIVKKVNGFIEKYQSNEVQANVEQPAQQTLTQTSLGKFKDFLIALSNGADRDGRVVVTTAADPSEACFRYLMLNPLVHFQEIVDQARSVVLCGGTMQPFEHFVTQLFSKISPGSLQIHFRIDCTVRRSFFVFQIVSNSFRVDTWFLLKTFKALCSAKV